MSNFIKIPQFTNVLLNYDYVTVKKICSASEGSAFECFWKFNCNLRAFSSNNFLEQLKYESIINLM